MHVCMYIYIYMNIYVCVCVRACERVCVFGYLIIKNICFRVCGQIWRDEQCIAIMHRSKILLCACFLKLCCVIKRQHLKPQGSMVIQFWCDHMPGSCNTHLITLFPQKTTRLCHVIKLLVKGRYKVIIAKQHFVGVKDISMTNSILCYYVSSCVYVNSVCN